MSSKTVQAERRVRDEVDYAAPGGTLLHRWFIQGELQRIFEYRQRQLPLALGVPATDCESTPVSITEIASRMPQPPRSDRVGGGSRCPRHRRQPPHRQQPS